MQGFIAGFPGIALRFHGVSQMLVISLRKVRDGDAPDVFPGINVLSSKEACHGA